jgi:hypothetical protein
MVVIMLYYRYSIFRFKGIGAWKLRNDDVLCNVYFIGFGNKNCTITKNIPSKIFLKIAHLYIR